MIFILRILISALGFYLGSRWLSGVRSQSFGTSIVVAIVVSLLSVTLGAVLKIMTLGLLAVGIFSLLLDAVLIMIADWLLDNFEVRNFWWALALAAIVAVIKLVMAAIILS